MGRTPRVAPTCAALLWAAWLVGCGDDAGPGGCVADSDSGCAPDGDGGAGGDGVANIPWLADGVPAIAAPDLSCPDGWRAVTGEDGVVTCDPYAEGGAGWVLVRGLDGRPSAPRCACPARVALYHEPPNIRSASR